jgi:glycosyltransferase involved in cell wall biosynthesis
MKKLIVLLKKNPFINEGAASNRVLGLLKYLGSNFNIELHFFGGYYSKNEKLDYDVKGKIGELNYVYINTNSNIGKFGKRLNEYFLLKYRLKHYSNRVSDYIDSGNFSKLVVWVENDYHSVLIFKHLKNKLLKSDVNVKYFMEVSEYLDVALTNNSVKYSWQQNRILEHLNNFDNYVLQNIDGIAFMTKSLFNLYENKLVVRNIKVKVMHLPMTVDLNRFDTVSASLIDNKITFVGSMNDKKDGVNILIDAFANISKDFPEYTLELYGFWGYDSDSHLQRISELGLNNKIIYSKPISAHTVIEKLKTSKLLVLPRPDSYQARGGFPTKLGEYLASGTPVIVSAVGEIPDYLVDNYSAYLVVPGSIDSLSDKISYALKNYNESVLIGRNGRKVAELYFSARKQSKALSIFLAGLFEK